jgi:hypothetical protein
MHAKPISCFPVPDLKDLPEDVRSRILSVQETSGFVPGARDLVCRILRLSGKEEREASATTDRSCLFGAAAMAFQRPLGSDFSMSPDRPDLAGKGPSSRSFDFGLLQTPQLTVTPLPFP